MRERLGTREIKPVSERESEEESNWERKQEMEGLNEKDTERERKKE